MGLEEDQFTNKNDNFTVTFNVNDGELKITPLAITVTITGNKDSKTYNGEEQEVEGYEVEISNDLYTKDDFTFSGEAIAKGTDVDTYPMGLTKDQFTNNNDNFDVTFNVTDGELKITKLAVTVTITGNKASKVYNGEEQKVEGYEVEISDPLYSEDDFTFSGEAIAKGTDVDTYPMGLTKDQFTNNNDNFDVTFNVTDGELKITKLAVTVTITGNKASKVYNGEEQKVEGYEVEISDPLYSEDDFTFSGEAIAKGTDVDTYPMGLTKDQFTNNNDNFDVTFNVTDGELKITKLAVTVNITGNDDSLKYNGSIQQVEGYQVDISDPLYTEADIAFSGEAIASGKNVGTYPMGLEKEQFSNTNNNFDVTFNLFDGSLEITKRSVTLTSATDSKTYDGTPLTNDEVTVSGDGFVEGEGATYDVTGTITDPGTAENTFSYALNEGTLAANYDITVVPGTLTINKITTEIIITADSDKKMYDGTPLTKSTYTYTEGVLAEGDVLTAVVEGTITNVGTTENKVVSYKVMRGETDVTANYTFGKSVDGTLEVTKRKVTLTSADDSKVYDGTPLTNDEVTVTGDGFVEGEGATYDVTGTITDPGTAENTFSYALNEGTLAANYDITVVPGTLTINKITTEIIITADSDKKMYDGTPLTKSTYTYTEGVLAEGDVLTAVVEGTITNVGTTENKVVSYKVMRGETDVTANYTFGESVDGELEITKRKVILTSADDSKTYDGTPLTNSTVKVTGDGWADGEGATYDVTGTITDPGTEENTFTYSLNEGTLAANYDIEVVLGKLTITKITKEIVITADSDSKTYDGTPLTKDTYTYTEGVLAEGDVLTAVVEGTITNVGTVANKVTSYKVMRGETDVTANYTFGESVDGELKITKRKVTLTSADGNKVYDGTPLVKNAQTDITVSGDGFVTGEGATYDITGSQTVVGSSENKFTYTLNEGTLADNYEIETVFGTLTVTKNETELKVESLDGTWTYDGKAHTKYEYKVTFGAETYTVTIPEGSLVGTATLSTGDVVTISPADSAKITHVAETTVDNAFTWNVARPDNYTKGEDTVGKLTVTPATLTIKTNDASKQYDGKPLTAPGTIDGFVEGENADFTVTGTITEVGKTPNSYTIIFKGEEGASANATAVRSDYTISETVGTLEITKNETELKIESKTNTWTYDGKAHTEYTYTVTFGTETYTVTVAEGATTAVATLANGDKVTITPAKAATITHVAETTVENTFSWEVDHFDQYAKITATAGTLSITPATLTIKTESASKEYDGQPLTADGTINGFVNGETATFKVTGTQTEVGKSDNTYTLTWDGTAVQSDYKLAETIGELEVKKSTKELKVESADGTWMYDGKAHTNKTYTVIYGDEVIKGTEGQTVFELSTGDKVTITPDAKATITHVAESNVDNAFTWTVENEAFYTKGTDKVGKLSITKRSVTMTSADDEKSYDGTALTNDEVTVTGDGFVEGEGATYNVTGSQTLVGNSENTFTYMLNDKTAATDYEIKTVFGTLTVTDEDVPDDLVVTKADAKEGTTYKLGDTVTFKITATNIYAEAKTITLTEIDGVTLAQSEFKDVEPGATVETTATYTITEADLLKGSFTNTVTATIDELVKEAEATVNTEKLNGHITIEKVTTSEPENGKTYALGETISYKITVTNDGNLTITDITVTDELTGDTWTIKSLAPGESETFTTEYEVTEADILAGEVLNVATATGKSPDPDEPDVPVTPGEDPEPTDEPNGHLTIEKVTTSEPENGKTYALGETISYKITVTNDGNLTITDITVTDELTGDTWTIKSLAPGESETFTTEYEVTEADILAGKVLNEATATGKSPDPDKPDVPVTPGTDEEPTDEPNGHITIEKVTTSEPANGESYALGEKITYKITVKNDGNLTITDIEVTDELTGDTWTIKSLAPGESEEFTAEYTVTEADILAGEVVNVATAKGTSPDPDEPEVPVTPGEDPEPTEDPNGHITIEKVTTSEPANGESYALGEKITYKITVKNDGNLTITDIEVTDELTGDTWTIKSLAPGESEEFTAEYTVTEADILAGEVVNVATAKGTSPDPDEPEVPVTPGEDPEPTEDPAPEISITKTVTSEPADKNGYVLEETITYEIVVKNEGNLTITGIKVVDELTGDTWTIESLAPGEEQKFEASYLVGVDDVVAGSVTNTAVVSGKASNEAELEESADVTVETTKVAIEITAASDTKEYDGTALTNDGYELTDGKLVDGNALIAVTVEGSQTLVGTSDNIPSKAVIIDADGGVVTAAYEITYVNGTLEVTQNTTALKVTADDDEKTYDGKPLTNDGYTLEGELPEGHTIEVVIEGTITNVGEEENVIVKVIIRDAEGNDVTDQFANINLENGTLTVTKRKLTLTSATDEKVYDGTPLTNDTVTIGGDGLAETDTITFNVTGTQTYVGTSDNTFTYEIGKGAPAAPAFMKKMLRAMTFGLMAEGDEADDATEPTVADNYDIEVVYGTLTVTDDVDDSNVIVKEHEGEAYAAGDTVKFTITVTNIYDEVKTITIEEIEGVTFTSEHVFENVAPGETVTATAEYVVTEEDIAAGTFKNTATATFSDVDKPYEGEDKVDLEEADPHITITKEVTNKPAEGDKFLEGETIEYKITVKNDGNLTAYDVVVTDELTGDEWTIDELAPDEEKVFTASYTVTAADAEKGTVVNTATATGSTIGDDPIVTPGTTETPVDKPVPVPKTGDESNLPLWTATMAMSAAAIGFVLIKKKREEEEEA